MRSVLQKPAVLTALCVGLLLIGVEAMFYVERDRLATATEVWMAFTMSVIYFGAVETLLPRERQVWLLSTLLSMNGFQSILSYLEKSAEPTWGGMVGRILIGTALCAVAAAVAEIIRDFRRGSKTSP